MRFPIAPLMAAAGLPSMNALRAVFPMSGTEYRRLQSEGLSGLQADRWAVKVGLNPAEVWPDWGADTFVSCASSDCDESFVPRDSKGQQRYCSATCRLREKARRYRATEHGAEAARRTRRAYYWSDPRIRAQEAAVKARPSARRHAAARRRELRAKKAA